MFKTFHMPQQMFKDKEKHILRKHYRLNYHLTSNILIPNKNQIIVKIGNKKKRRSQLV